MPGLLIQGELDANQSVDDALELVSDWGGTSMDLVVVSHAGHVPRIEPSPSHEAYWAALLNFLAL